MTHVKRFALAALVAGLAGLWQSSAHAQLMRDPTAEEAYKAGQQLLTEEKYKDAVAAFNKALAVDQTYAEAYVGKGDALKALDDFQPAALAYSRALEIDAQSAVANNGLGECHLELGMIDLASSSFHNALELDPSNPKVLSNLGHILVNYNRDPASAIRRLDDAIALNDKDARAFRDRGFAHALMRDFEKAEADMKRAVDVEPTDYENYSAAASVYLLQDAHESAIAALAKAIETYKPKKSGEPDKFLSGYIQRAQAELSMGEQEKDQAKSRAAFEAVIADADAVIAEIGERPEGGGAYYYKGRAERMLGRYSDAVNSLTEAIQLASTSQDASYVADALMYRGICWYYIGEPDLAHDDFEQASATGGGYQDPRVFLWMGYTHHKKGNHRDAINSYSEAIAKSPGYALAHVNKGRAYMDLKEYKQAIECFNDAIRAEPSVGENYYNVGYAYMQLKEYKKAEAFLNLAIHKANPQPRMFRLMAAALRGLGKNDLAEEYERKANALAPAQASDG